MRPLAVSPLRRVVLESQRVATRPDERCELCSEPLLADRHRHLLDAETRELLCACQACSMLFGPHGSGGEHYRLVPDRRLELVDFRLDDGAWQGLNVPVGVAFFVKREREGSIASFYPSPMGPTESVVDPGAWAVVVADNPILESMASEVEALLVRRSRDESGYWLVPIDEAFQLSALVRREWKGLSGGTGLWRALDRYFEELGARSRKATTGAGGERTRTR